MQSSRRTALPPSRPFTTTDKIALAAAGLLAGVFFLTHARSPALDSTHVLTALAVTAAFAALGWHARGVDISGALAGAAVAFILTARDIRLFCLLLLVFAVTLAATRVGGRRKQKLQTAEAAAGRSASQVMANLGVAALLAAMAEPPAWIALTLAALAEAAADTSSSEIGMAFSGKTVLITSWKPTRPGVDGGVSFHGTVTALLAAAVIALAARLFGLVSTRQAAVIACAGFVGTLADSLLGALVERRGWLDNDLVNLLSTVTAVGVAWMSM